MKAIGFFAAVFLSMLGFFVVVTGEFESWVSRDEEATSELEVRVHRNRATGGSDGKNVLDFDFWNVRLGRRNFTIRAELPAADLKSGSRIDELERIQLANGSIEIPLFGGKKLTPASETVEEDGQVSLDQLVLEFQTATYIRSGGLAKGGREIVVLLRNGKGSTNEGTEFRFEELLFTNGTGQKEEEGEASRFSFRSDHPVSIVNRYLEVHSQTGLRGEIGQNGVESVTFLSPVRATVDPGVVGDFALGAGVAQESLEEPGRGVREEGARGQNGDPRRRVVALCDGPLEFDFHAKATADPAAGSSDDGRPAKGGDDDGDSPTRITFRDNVVLHSARAGSGVGGKPPESDGNRFECQELILEVDDDGERPVPRRALATWEGGRVRTRIVHGDRTYVLDGDRLEWINLDSAAEPGRPGILSVGYLTGSPKLRGPEVELDAERAVLRPHADTVLLEKVEGTFRGGRHRAGRSTDGEGRARAVVRSSLDGGGAGASARVEPAAIDGSSVSKGRRELVDFSAPRVEVVFGSDPAGGQKGLTRCVARGEGPRDVRIRSRGAVGTGSAGAGPPGAVSPFAASGRTLTYDATKHEAKLEGAPGELPRLTQGSSWIEAGSIHLLVDSGPGAAWFQDQVKARIDPVDFSSERAAASVGKRDGDGKQNKDEEGRSPRPLSIEADYLGLAFRDGRELETALARGGDERAVKLETLSGTKYVFHAREVRLEQGEKIVELLSSDVEPARLASMEMPGGSVRARHIRFEQQKRLVTLEGAVELRLTDLEADPEKDSDADLVVRAATATVELLDRESRGGAALQGAGPLAALNDVKSLAARGGEGEPLVVESVSFRLHGDHVDWDAESRRLVFRGPGMQQVFVHSGQLRGPVQAREIVFDEKRGVVVLQTAVRGELRQPAKRASEADAATRAGEVEARTVVWEFETNALEIKLREVGAGRRFEVGSLLARDKVLLYNPDQAVLLRGDDLVYDSTLRQVEVFSRDGRRQTLQHFRSLAGGGPGLDAVKAAGASDPDGPVDTIHAQRIFASLEENADAGNPPGRPRQMLLVEFRRDVLANFFMPGTSGLAAAGAGGKHWQLIAQRLTLHVDPAATSRGPRAVPWALATGSAEGAHRNVTINTGPYQAFAERAELQAPAHQLVLTGSPGFPVTIADRRPDRSGTIEQEKHLVIVVRKVGQEVIIDSPRRAPTTEPWPGVSNRGDD